MSDGLVLFLSGLTGLMLFLVGALAFTAVRSLGSYTTKE